MVINLKEINSVKEFHSTMNERLQFPEGYGMNWDAFWDTITALVEMPVILELNSFDEFCEKFPLDGKILQKIVDDYNHRMVNSKIIIG